MTWYDPPSRRLSMLLLLALSFGPVQAATAGRASAPDWRQAETMAELVSILDLWLDEQSPWPRRAEPPVVRQVGIHRAHALAGSSARTGVTLRGFYDDDAVAIYMVRPWSPRRVQDVGVLVHELVHHRQQGTGYWYCAGAQELPAYELQEKWLNAQDASGRINWVAAVLESGCSPKDFHPD